MFCNTNSSSYFISVHKYTCLLDSGLAWILNIKVCQKKTTIRLSRNIEGKIKGKKH